MATNDSVPYLPTGVVLWNDLFTPRLPKDAGADKVAKYSVRLGFTAEDLETPEFKAAKARVVALAHSEWDSKFKGGEKTVNQMLQEGSIRLPFRKDIASKGYDDSIVCFINLQSVQAPGIVSRYIDPDTGKARRITDPAQVWSGCLGKVSYGAFAYGGPGTTFNPGISFGLRNFCLMNVSGVKYGRLDGRRSAEDDFAGEVLPEDSSVTGQAGKDELNDLLS